ncbi:MULTISPECIES: GAF domain-containing protein, partial [unclassified Frankia]|uniref:GAF domain-containing protein n=1 Tax=unclassified Frankia TaxID=2632575 RepID=UPI001EF42545
MRQLKPATGSRRHAAPVPEVLLSLDEEYGAVLALLDRSAAIARMVVDVPRLAGVDVAWVGEPDGVDQIVLGRGVNVATEALNGIVVPVGAGLGGKVLTARRPLWVSDYCASSEITQDFAPQAATEGLKAMIAVPIMHDGRVLGVLYGANRTWTQFGDRTA